MAKTLLYAALMILALTLGAPGRGHAQAPAPLPGDSLRLTVDGMVCSLCAYGVERRLKKLDHVQHVQVELDSGLVVLVLEPGAALADSALAREVRKAGFALRHVGRFTRDKKLGP
ncbi:MAG: heavy-metal-associated domain-containing protein [Gemmatimonadales bacterium]